MHYPDSRWQPRCQGKSRDDVSERIVSLSCIIVGMGARRNFSRGGGGGGGGGGGKPLGGPKKICEGGPHIFLDKL